MSATISTQQEWFTNYVSSTMSTLGVHEPDADGDLPVQGVTSRGWVHVETEEPWGVRVFAFAAVDVAAKVAVLKEINAVNAKVRLGCVFLAANGTVIVEHLLLADAVNADALRATLSHVLGVADHVGQLVATVHGGTLPIPQPTPSDR